jgi:hypothetical protein
MKTLYIQEVRGLNGLSVKLVFLFLSLSYRPAVIFCAELLRVQLLIQSSAGHATAAAASLGRTKEQKQWRKNVCSAASCSKYIMYGNSKRYHFIRIYYAQGNTVARQKRRLYFMPKTTQRRKKKARASGANFCISGYCGAKQLCLSRKSQPTYGIKSVMSQMQYHPFVDIWPCGHM